MSGVEELNYKIGILIKKLRKDSNLSQVDLARQSGLDRTYISRVEKGNANITIASLYLICNVLKISVKDFFSQMN